MIRTMGNEKDLFELYEDAGIFFLRAISRHLGWQLSAQDIWELAAIANGGGYPAFTRMVEWAHVHGRFPWNDPDAGDPRETRPYQPPPADENLSLRERKPTA